MKQALSPFAVLTVGIGLLIANPSFAKSTMSRGMGSHSAMMGRSAGLSSMDRQFMIHTAQANIGEVKGGQLALTRAVSASVRDFAQKMVTDHNHANTDLKGLARSKGIRLPNDTDLKHKRMAGQLAKRSGETFDRAYIKAMVAGHKEVIAMFRDEAMNGRDPDVKSWARKTLPTLQDHLRHAMQVSRDVHR